MGKLAKRALKSMALAAVVVGVAATPSSADSTGWIYYDGYCPYLNGCGMIEHLNSGGANTNDYGCPGSVGLKIKYYVGSTAWISGLTYQPDYIAKYHSNTFGVNVYHT